MAGSKDVGLDLIAKLSFLRFMTVCTSVHPLPHTLTISELWFLFGSFILNATGHVQYKEIHQLPGNLQIHKRQHF